jgi:hypothetical protein
MMKLALELVIMLVIGGGYVRREWRERIRYCRHCDAYYTGRHTHACDPMRADLPSHRSR